MRLWGRAMVAMLAAVSGIASAMPEGTTPTDPVVTDVTDCGGAFAAPLANTPRHWNLLRLHRKVAERILANPVLAPRYVDLVQQAVWLETGDARAFALALESQFGGYRRLITHALLTRQNLLFPPPTSMLALAEQQAGVSIPATLRDVIYLSVPPLRPEPVLANPLPNMPHGTMVHFIATYLRPSEIIAQAKKYPTLGRSLLRRGQEKVAADMIAKRMVHAYDSVRSEWVRVRGNPPYRVFDFWKDYKDRFDPICHSQVKSTLLCDVMLDALFRHLHIGEDDYWNASFLLENMHVVLGNFVERLVASQLATERAAAEAAKAAADIAAANTPPPVKSSPPIQVESVEARMARIAAHAQAREAARVIAEEDEAAVELPTIVVPGTAPRARPTTQRSLTQLIREWAIDAHAAEQIFAAMEKFDNGEFGGLRRMLQRLADGVRTFDLGPNFGYAHDYSIWKIRPQKTSNFRLLLQFAGNRPYLLGLAEVKSSKKTQLTFFGHCRDRWHAFLGQP